MIEALFLFIPAVVLIGGLFLIKKGETHVTAEENEQLAYTTKSLLNRHELNRSELDFLLTKHTRSGENENSDGYIIRTMIFRKNIDYYLAIVSSNDLSKKLEKITELRARRALYNHKEDYFVAFGEFPDRKQIKELLESKQ